jgi:uncharacterized membrane protein YeaQ/YmgE (transglycosylase-associated protein family)
MRSREAASGASRVGIVRPVSIFGWIVVGLIAGWLARIATGYRRPPGCLFTLAIGVLGGLLGGFIFTAFGGEGISDFSWWSIFVAFVGAVLLLLVLGAISGMGRRR